MAFDDTKVREYLRTTHETPLLTEREKHLIGLAVTMTRGCQVCTRNRIEKARAARRSIGRIGGQGGRHDYRGRVARNTAVGLFHHAHGRPESNDEPAT